MFTFLLSLYTEEYKNSKTKKASLSAIGKIEETLLKALGVHRSSKDLYKYAINFKLSQIKQNLEKEQANAKYFADLNEYVNSVFENMKDYEYYFEILSLTDSYNFEYANKIKTVIEEKIKKSCSDIPKAWDLFAQRADEGKILCILDCKNVSVCNIEDGSMLACTKLCFLTGLNLWYLRSVIMLGKLTHSCHSLIYY